MLSKADVSFVIIFLSLVCQIVAFEFLPSCEEGVIFGNETGGVRNIYVDENNNSTRRVKVVIIDEAKSIPIFEAYGYDKLLQITIVKGTENSDQYYVEINSLDYEAISDKKFTILIKVTSEQKFLTIDIQNLDDEQPTLTATACKMKESTPITVDNTECRFTIRDPDGFLDLMNFSNIIPNGRDEDKLFQLVYQGTPDQKVIETYVYLVLQNGKLLDYETVSLYTFHVNATDHAGHPTRPIESVPIIVQVDDIPDEPPAWTL